MGIKLFIVNNTTNYSASSLCKGIKFSQKLLIVLLVFRYDHLGNTTHNVVVGLKKTCLNSNLKYPGCLFRSIISSVIGFVHFVFHSLNALSLLFLIFSISSSDTGLNTSSNGTENHFSINQLNTNFYCFIFQWNSLLFFRFFTHSMHLPFHYQRQRKKSSPTALFQQEKTTYFPQNSLYHLFSLVQIRVFQKNHLLFAVICEFQKMHKNTKTP